MSTARAVPETWRLTGDDARATLEHVGRARLLADAWQRLRWSDGFSHARALAFTISLVIVQATVGLVGLAEGLGPHGGGDVIVRAVRSAVPGPAGDVLTSAVTHAKAAGVAHHWLALALGAAGAVVTGTIALGQLERALNRLYGVEEDRPSTRKYGLALLLTLTAGVLAAVAFVALVFGREVGNAIHNSAVSTAWDVARWPIALVVLVAAFGLLMKWCPRRHQPAWSWLAYGATVSVVSWSLVTLALAGFFRVGSTFGDTYGPLAGVVALLVWSGLSSSVLLYGAAVAAQLEAVRVGEPEPQDGDKAEEGEPARGRAPAPRRGTPRDGGGGGTPPGSAVAARTR